MTVIKYRNGRLFLSYIFLLFIVSCKKEGPAGAKGEDGNANVRSGTITLTNTDWKWNSTWAFTTNTGTSTLYTTRYADINTPLISQSIADKGSVQLFFKPYSSQDAWAPLPFIYLDITRSYYFNIVFEYSVGRIRVHYYWTPNAVASPPGGLSTYVLPDYTFKYVITEAK
ncbi:MAG: hypothetical protein J7578_20550 [Chitinophagaceae bacterium]|nr:hypothetical protein [Chitinophagaceae bacterium]